MALLLEAATRTTTDDIEGILTVFAIGFGIMFLMLCHMIGEITLRVAEIKKLLEKK